MTGRRATGARRRTAPRRTKPRLVASVGGALVVLVAASCAQPLPEAESPAARTYVAQCGMCHAAYPPAALTAAMWEIQVGRMDEYRRRRGIPPLGAAERAVILDYLRAHAG